MSDSVEMSSGNIFADIGDPEPDRTLARAQVMHRIACIIEERGLTQAQAVKQLGISQARVSKLINGKLDQFSLDQLLTLLNKLDRDVEILIKPKAPGAKVGVTRVLLVSTP